MSANITHNISLPHCSNITPSLQTGRGRNTQALILNGTTNPAPTDSPWKTTSGNSCSDMAIQSHANHRDHPTSIVKLYTVKHTKSTRGRHPPPPKLPLASNASKELSASYYTIPEQSKTNYSQLSDPSALNKPGPPKPLTKRPTTYCTTLLPIPTMESLIDPET